MTRFRRVTPSRPEQRSSSSNLENAGWWGPWRAAFSPAPLLPTKYCCHPCAHPRVCLPDSGGLRQRHRDLHGAAVPHTNVHGPPSTKRERRRDRKLQWQIEAIKRRSRSRQREAHEVCHTVGRWGRKAAANKSHNVPCGHSRTGCVYGDGSCAVVRRHALLQPRRASMDASVAPLRHRWYE